MIAGLASYKAKLMKQSHLEKSKEVLPKQDSEEVSEEVSEEDSKKYYQN